MNGVSQRAVFHLLLAALMGGLLLLAWIGDIRQPSALEQIKRRGVLVVGTQVGPSTYYRTEEGARGFEYELLRRFADAHGLDLRVELFSGLQALAAALETGRVDLVAAGIGPTPQRLDRFIFTDPFMHAQPVAVYRYGEGQPDSIEDLVDERVEVIAGSYHEERLRALRVRHPELRWDALEQRRPETLLYRVWNDDADVAITDANKLTMNQRFYPELRIAFELGDPRPLAWMLRADAGSLRDALNRHLRSVRDRGILATLNERYYGHLDEFDYVGTRVFLRHVAERLPQYRETFQEAAADHGLDWRLLAAAGYQESHWDPEAVSPTGVRGVMMLTLSTAEQVGVENRLDPVQSIHGGAEYLASVRSRLPEDIPEPDRTWFALAAYNVGLGHLEDARVITETQGGDPDSWADVKERLPLLADPDWYPKTRYGYARGGEPVAYVEHIRQYYQLLVRVTDPGLLSPPPALAAEEDTLPPSGDWELTAEAESAL
jgi:membrane-bound lytic murein transglycosylase F